MRGLAILFCTVMWVCAAWAQDTAEDDRGYLTRLLEENLSTEDQEVTITGFAGALSSQATMAKLTIADSDGIWLSLEDVVLDWSRAALLRGRVEVNTLSAAKIDLSRLPKSEPKPPEAAATEFTGFALPELPVSVAIGQLDIEEVTLGASILGQALRVSVEGDMQLADGAGSGALTLKRLDDIAGTWVVEGSYANASRELMLNIDLSEAAGGVVATRLNLPGAPAARLWVTGAGPIDLYSAKLGLETDGTQRLAGELTLEALIDAEGVQTGERRAEFTLGGDIAPLFAPEHRAFFGDDLQLASTVYWQPGHGIRVEGLSLNAQSMNLKGAAKIGAGGWPEHFALEAIIEDPQGKAVLLPGRGQDTRIRQAEFSLRYDAAASNRWTGALTVEGLMRPDLTLERARVGGSGRIARGEGGVGIGQITADMAYALEGIGFANPAMGQATGERITGAILALWNRGEPLELKQFALAGDDFRVLGQLMIDGLSDALRMSGKIQVNARDLSRWAALAGRDLGGAAQFDLAGWVKPLGGAFDLQLGGGADGLRIGQAEADRLLAGRSELTVSLLRDTKGLSLRQLNVTSPQAQMDANGRLGAVDGDLSAEAMVKDVAVLVDGFSGPLTSSVTAKRQGGDWQVDAGAQQGGNADLSVTGHVAPDGQTADLRGTGRFALGLLNGVLAPRSLGGMADLDVGLRGPLALTSVSGRLSASDARFSAPNLRTALRGVQANVDVAEARAEIDLRGGLASGGRVTLDGNVGLTAPFAGSLNLNLDRARLIDPELYDARLNADITADGPLSGGAQIRGRIDMLETEIRVPSSSGPGIGNLPDLVHVNEPAAVRQSRARAGLIKDESQGGSAAVYPLDILIDAPGRIFVRGRGLDAELGGSVRIKGTTSEVEPEGGLELIRGRLDILGRRLTLTEGLVQMQGSLSPWMRMVATADVPDAEVFVTVQGQAENPEISFTSQPDLPEDEVLALLLFGRSITEISAFQAAQLAAAVATLAGHGGDGVVGTLRQKFGLDDFDVTSSEEGGTEVKAGKYLSDNLYTEVEVGQDGSSDVNLILDLSPSVTVKGGLGQDGDTSFGIFFERDY